MKSFLKKLGKRGVFNQMIAAAIGVVVLVLTLAVLFILYGNLAANTQIAANANATTTVTEGREASMQFVSWIGTVVIVIIIVLLITLIAGLRRLQTG